MPRRRDRGEGKDPCAKAARRGVFETRKPRAARRRQRGEPRGEPRVKNFERAIRRVGLAEERTAYVLRFARRELGRAAGDVDLLGRGAAVLRSRTGAHGGQRAVRARKSFPQQHRRLGTAAHEHTNDEDDEFQCSRTAQRRARSGRSVPYGSAGVNGLVKMSAPKNPARPQESRDQAVQSFLPEVPR